MHHKPPPSTTLLTPSPHQLTPRLHAHHHPPSSRLYSLLTSHSLHAPIPSYMHNCTNKYAWTQVWSRRVWTLMHTYINTHECIPMNFSDKGLKSWIQLAIVETVYFVYWLRNISGEDEMQSHPPMPLASSGVDSSGGNKRILPWIQKVRFVPTLDMEPLFNPHPDYSSISSSFHLSALPSKSSLSTWLLSHPWIW